MSKRIVTAACAVALGVAWTMAPAFAADDTAKDKMERAKDTTKEGMETAKDKVGNAVDTTKEKTSGAVEKTKEKSAEVKDSIKNKVSGANGSADVRQAQQALADQGISPGPIDGKMGPKTKAALTEYQKKENLKATGRLDHETKSKLVARSASSKKMDTTTPAASPSTTSSTTPSSSKVDTSAPSAGNAPPSSPAADQSTPKKQTQ